MTLVNVPGKWGETAAVDPAAVTAIQPYRTTVEGQGARLVDCSIIWIQNRTLFICALSCEEAVNRINAARSSQADIFAAGYHAGIADDRMTSDVETAWRDYSQNGQGPSELPSVGTSAVLGYAVVACGKRWIMCGGLYDRTWEEAEGYRLRLQDKDDYSGKYIIAELRETTRP